MLKCSDKYNDELELSHINPDTDTYNSFCIGYVSELASRQFGYPSVADLGGFGGFHGTPFGLDPV